MPFFFCLGKRSREEGGIINRLNWSCYRVAQHFTTSVFLYFNLPLQKEKKGWISTHIAISLLMRSCTVDRGKVSPNVRLQWSLKNVFAETLVSLVWSSRLQWAVLWPQLLKGGLVACCVYNVTLTSDLPRLGAWQNAVSGGLRVLPSEVVGS